MEARHPSDLVDSLYYATMRSYWEPVVALDPIPTRPRLMTVADMDRLVAAEPALWFWRQVRPGLLRVVQSWAHRPPRARWRQLQRNIIAALPIGVFVEFRGCPRPSSRRG